MRNDNQKSVIVGIFVLVGIAILVAGIMTLGGQQKRFVQNFRLRAVFDDVAGLQTGNNVWFSGVKIGTVRKINFYGDSQVEIEMNVEEKVREYIHKDSKATISSDGLIGNKIIVLYGGTTQTPAVEDGDRMESVMPLDTDKMMETLQENNKNLVSITNDLKILTGKIADGEGIIGSVLTDSLLAENFRGILVNLQQTSIKSNQMVGELSKFSSNLNQEGTLINDLITDKELYSSLQSSIAEIQSTAENAKGITQNLNQATDKLNNTENAVGMLLNDLEFASTLKSTMVKVDSSTMNLNSFLEALEYTWPFRGGFRKKNRVEEENQ